MQNPDKPQHQLSMSILQRDYEQEYLHAKLKSNKRVLRKQPTHKKPETDFTNHKNQPEN
jgi:hypothetical protein